MITLDQMCLQIAKRFGHATSGTATAGSTTTLTDTARLIQADSYWNNSAVYFLTGASAGLSRLVSGYAASTLTFVTALLAPATSGDTYQLLPRQRQDFVDVIQEAIRKAGESWMVMKDYTAPTGFTTNMEYALPADLIALSGVYSGDGVFWQPVTAWEVVPSSLGPDRLLVRQWPRWPYLNQNQGTVQVAEMRLEYLSLPTQLDELVGAGSLGVGAGVEREMVSFITEYALHLLHQAELSRNVTGQAARTHVTLADKHYSEAMRIMSMRKTIQQPKTLRTRSYPSQVQ